jgi:hypothetical protein
MPQFPPDPELKAIESALGEFVPRSSRLDRDKLMFQAGAISRSTAKPRRWVWPAVTAALTIALAAESLFLGTRPAPWVVERFVLVPAPQPAPAAVEAAAAAQANVSPEPENTRPQLTAASDPFPFAWWGVESDYQRLQDLMIRFGLDALPERPAVASRSDGGNRSPSPGLRPAGALRSLELERIFNPGDPS